MLPMLCCRDAEVLSLFAAIINKLKERMVAEVPKIFEAVFQVTLQMITKNFEVSHGVKMAPAKKRMLLFNSRILLFRKKDTLVTISGSSWPTCMFLCSNPDMH